MKIALLTLTRGTVSGGYAKYLREVVPRLREHREVEELRVYAPPQVAAIDRSFLTWPESRPLETAQWLRREIGAWQPDVVFIPSSVYVDFQSIPVVTMVRNMEPLERPFSGGSIAESLRNVVRAAAARRACRRSSRVIAVSRHVRDFIIDRWKIDPERVGCVYHGTDAASARVRPAGMPSGERPFLFTAGSIRPSRGLEDLIDAVIAGGIPEDHFIVIAGSVDRGAERYAAALRTQLDRVHVTDRVVWLGRISPEEMAWCCANTRLFVMTSRAEACPNTVLEALAYACLSVSTDQPPMPEFFGDAAVYYARENANDLSRAIGEALELDAAASDALRTRAVTRSQQFSWNTTVEATIRELRVATSGQLPPTEYLVSHR